jgi:predicted secreted hydrolase
MRRLRGAAAAALLTAALVGAGILLRRAVAPASAPPSGHPAAEALLGGTGKEGFERATSPRPFRFPEDQGPHPGFRHEWWYFTGNLRTPDGRQFGYQLTFFRFALSPPGGPPRASRWATTQAYMAHFAVTDVRGRRFRFFERLGRGAMELAGASSIPFRVWIDDWSADGGAAPSSPVRLRAGQAGVSIDLTLDPERPVLPQGDRGLSRKGAEPGNASYYYSISRLATRGTVRIDGIPEPVEGTSWLDREWGTSALNAEQTGWDWFALQLSDGRDLMFYRFRKKDGGEDPFSAGTLLLPDGSRKRLSAADVRIDALGSWRSPASGVRYPSGWKVRLPSEVLALEVLPRLPDQELRTSVRYWEGAVSVRGTAQGAAVAGEGYVELTGYGSAEAP